MPKERLIQEIIENLARCQRPALSPVWQKIGLSRAQLSMLYLLAYHSDVSVKQISEYLGVTKSAVTQLLEPLVEKKFVSRRTDQDDRRIARLSLTPKGHEILKLMAKYKFVGLRAALESLNTKELEQLHKLHKKMAINAL
ncbi:MAG TPA: MarR family transcriptional regulator [Candidatus Saccharimonadales bacterium]|nr:MarR family transcriptional regulator [Candidatus Saccharimonadales bacterium]